MNDIYILMLIALATLAIMDLVIGVSNDAVNFLNSAIGSKAIKYRNIMIIASLGIFLGAATSSGMMEVARKGIFVPGEFYFNELMYIFMSVMITDILLLDVFNTIGMPTSTTVSIVFELLGAAVVLAFIKVSMTDGIPISDIGKYINSTKAIQIISGIFLSVIIAFTVGAIVMFLSRLIYTYNFENKGKIVHAVFGGIAITAITYFIIIKGVKGSSLYSSVKDILSKHQLTIIFGSFILWSIIGYLLIATTRFNLLKFIIGLGTFSLALAFSGNDLVNFIGVPITALDSYEIWKNSGVPANEYLMSALAEGVKTNNTLLLLAGIIMVITLWFSKKARNVAETEINLSRQNEGTERFKPNNFSRAVVRGATAINEFISGILPEKTRQNIDLRFQRSVIKLPLDKKHELPAFDMVRAAVNLVMAAILISFATSLKLPLSTTYVTFMVAMGTSLADRAWGLDSAVYRVAGVLSVIGGWFLTALIAFMISGAFVFLIYIGKMTAIAVLLILVFGIILKNFISFKKKQITENERTLASKASSQNIAHIIQESSNNIAEVVKRVNKLYSNVYTDLRNHDLDKLKNNKKHVDKLEKEVNSLENEMFYYIKNMGDESLEGSKFYIMILRHIQDISQSINYISTSSFNHVNNNHKKLKKAQLEDLKHIEVELSKLLKKVQHIFENDEFIKLDTVIEEKFKLFSEIEGLISTHVERIRTDESSPKNSTLHFGILLETKDLLNSILSVSELFSDFSKLVDKQTI